MRRASRSACTEPPKVDVAERNANFDALTNHPSPHPEFGINDLVPGAPVLAEFGDAPNRYKNGKHRRCYAGTAPITHASGTRHVVLARFIRNRRLADACYLWAFSALTASCGARTLYNRQRDRGATHHQALGTAARIGTSRLACFAGLKGCLDAEAVSEGVPGGRRAGRAGA